MPKRKININFRKSVHDPKFQKAYMVIRRKTGRLKQEDYHKRFTI